MNNVNMYINNLLLKSYLITKQLAGAQILQHNIFSQIHLLELYFLI